MAITSPHNDKLKTVRKLRARRHERERLGLFVAEGEDLLAAADAGGWVALERFAAAGSGLPGVEVDAALLGAVSELASGARTLAIYRQRWVTLADRGPGRLCVFLDGVGDPGNVGTILRAAAAFGAGAVVLGAGSADPFSPKAVRASMGAIFQVPVVRAGVAELPGVTVALAADGEATLAELAGELDPGIEVSILIGSERGGLGSAAQQAADHVVRIPIANESLNAAMAATVALYELSRRISC